MGRVIMSGVVPQLEKPISGIKLSELAEGSIVKLNENGSPVDFYVVCHNYESTLNGTGRTLLVRKDCYGSLMWNNASANNYASSSIDTWLNGDYKALLNSDVQDVIGETTFYYTLGNNNTTVTTLERSVFLLSVTEYGKTNPYANTEGSALPIASTLQIAYLSGQATTVWTRTPYNGSVDYVCYMDATGSPMGGNVAQGKRGIRPCFTLPNTAFFDEDTLLFKGVA